jgi:hypothetical protein
MNKKILSVCLVSFLFAVVMLSLGSAAVTIENISPAKLSVDGNSFTFDLNFTEEYGDYEIQIDDMESITFSPDQTSFSEPVNLTQMINVEYNASDFNFKFGKTYSTIIKIINTSNSEIIAHSSIQFEEINFCEGVSNEGELNLQIEDVKVIRGFGDDEDYWYPFDVIEFEVEVENEGSWDIDNVEIVWELYTTEGKKIDDGDLSDFNLKEGKDETRIFTIVLDEDIDEFEAENAVLYIKAIGEIDDNDSPYDGEDTCDYRSLEVDVRADENFVIMNNFKINGVQLNFWDLENEVLACGQEITFTADVWNIGDRDQDDVYIRVYNEYMEINEVVDIGDIDGFENEDFTFTFNIPEGLEEKWYSLKFDIYDDDDDIFENSEDDLAKFEAIFKVESCNIVIPPIISAELDSEAIEGKDLVIKTMITNNNNYETLYSITVKGYETWADLQSISGDVLRLDAGETVEVIITFDTKKESAGDQIFYLNVFSDNELVSEQPIGVSIKQSGSNFTDWFKDNWKLAGIILLNLILVIAIIIVAVRIYRR